MAARRAPKKSKSILKKLVLSITAALILLAAIVGGNYWYEGHPRYPVGTCLEGDGVQLKIYDIKDNNYYVLIRIPNYPMLIKAFGPVRKVNARKWTKINCVDAGFLE